MLIWKQKFLEHRLKQGKILYVENRVVNFQEKKGIYTASISGNQLYNIRITIENEIIKRMSCICPLAKAGNNCDHMAAVLWAIEAKSLAAAGNRTEEEVRAEWKKELESSEGEKKAPRKVSRQEQEKKRQREKEAEKEKQRAIEEAQKAWVEEERARKIREQEEQERLKKEQEERERKRQEREKRKQEKAARDAENKRRIAEAREAEAAKRKAEEERREQIRQQKALEAQMKVEKRRQEEEAARLAAIRKEEELRRQEEENRRQMEKRAREERKKKEKERKEAEIRQRAEAERKASEEEKLRLQKQKELERSQNYVLVGDAWEADSEELQKEAAAIEAITAYRYYDAQKIRQFSDLQPEQAKKGRALLQSGRLRIEHVRTGHMHEKEEAFGEIAAIGKYYQQEFPVRLIFSQDQIIQSNCNCPECRGWYNFNGMCDYRAGVIDYLTDYLKQHNIGDATSRTTLSFMQRFRKNQFTSQDLSQKQQSGSPQYLVPRLIKKDGMLTLAFKFGENKMFVVKNLETFCNQVEGKEEGTYGTNTVIQHNLDLFDEASVKWFRLLKQIVQEEQNVREKIQRKDFYINDILNIGNSVELFGWRLDAVYERLKIQPMDFEDWDQQTKWKTTMQYGELKPKLELMITSKPVKKGPVLHGVTIQGTMPPFFEGANAVYYLSNNILSKVEPEYYQKIEPLIEMAEDGKLRLEVGRNSLSEFYHHILPELREVVNVTERNGEWIRSYLLPKARYFFYLDASEHGIFAEADVHYGNKRYPLFDYFDKKRVEEIADYRDREGEHRVLDVLTKYLNCYDEKANILHNNGDEDKAYNLYAHGIEELNAIGEVHCTRQFLNLRKVKKAAVSVGVRVSEGMLNLDILTQDLTDQELLDILKSYRQKKKYYRLKDGSFVNLEDPALETITEMVDVLHLTKEELKKKNISLPLYRALYLDKLLAENEELYEDRDAVIRRMASQFQTIENTEYDVPKSLKKIMRSYQRDGFKWMKTLEGWGFGGILADEMGLGKTLQTISVLLSAKEEGKEGTSLIICPASLVYNWEEEIHRFAPLLQVKTVTGTQAERAEILAQMEADVLVTSYDLLKRDITSYDGKEFLFEVIDEAQYIKNHGTAAAKSVKAIKSKIRFALTGTPVENRLSELWSIFDYLMPGFLYGYETFRKEYELPIVKNEEEETMQRLQRMTGPFILRRRKTDVLKDLPEKLEEVRYVKMEEKQQHLYDGQLVQIRNELSGQSEQEFNQNKIKILTGLTRLRQLCCDPSLCMENYRGGAAKTEACLDLIQGAIDGGHRMLVFSQFTSMLDILRERLDKAGISYYILTGSTSKEERASLVEKYNEGDVPVFLISLKAGGVGLNLTGADLVIHYDPWWNVAAQNQATDRAHRIGQKKKVTVYKLITKGTIEEKIMLLQEKKKALADQILSGESAQMSSLSKDELMEILTY